MMRKLLSLYSSGRMNAATPDGAPLWRIDDQKFLKKNSLLRRASERPWGGSPSCKIRFSWFRCEPNRFMWFLQNQF